MGFLFMLGERYPPAGPNEGNGVICRATESFQMGPELTQRQTHSFHRMGDSIPLIEGPTPSEANGKCGRGRRYNTP